MLRLADGTLVMSIIIYWGAPHASPDPAVARSATSVVAYRAIDGVGLAWEYAGTILDAAFAPNSEEGSNENNLALMAESRILGSLRSWLTAGSCACCGLTRAMARRASLTGCACSHKGKLLNAFDRLVFPTA